MPARQRHRTPVNACEIIGVFEAVFEGVRLVGGFDEPYYRPDEDASGKPALICFKEDFAASALHEVAHWCIAGRRRRQLPDFGYWYEPARDADTQSRFEQVEAKPQALEWIFSIAAGRKFRVSFDNFDLPACRLDAFRRRVQTETLARLDRGLPPRASRFAEALADRSGNTNFLNPHHYKALPC